jgi:hypothetical protein
MKHLQINGEQDSANSVRRDRLMVEVACHFRNYVCPSTNPRPATIQDQIC